jgi:hypothetical protein
VVWFLLSSTLSRLFASLPLFSISILMPATLCCMRRWVQLQSIEAPMKLWVDGAEDYLKYARRMMEENSSLLEPSEREPEGQPETGEGEVQNKTLCLAQL